MDIIKHFYLERIEDVSGTSGTGIVARGIVLPSGRAILEWNSFHSSIAIYQNLEDVVSIHSHEGRTKIIMGDPPSGTKQTRRKQKASSKT